MGVSLIQITLLVLIRNFQIDWLKVSFLKEVESAIKSWFCEQQKKGSMESNLTG